MSLRPSHMNKALRSAVDEIHAESMDEDDKAIDFGNVGLYLAGLQVTSTIVVCSCSSILSCWMLPDHAISAVRTLAITTTIGLIMVRKPVRIGRVRGVSTVFNALRPAVATYILALIIEQLVHTCVPSEEEEHTTLRRVVYHVMATVMIASAFARARAPRSESDIPFALTAFCVLAIALLPPPALARAGPLCEPATLIQAGERCLRALFFACVYTVHVYAAAPGRNISNELFICVARATAASVWILCASSWTLPGAPLQVAIVLFSRLGEHGPELSHDEQYAHVPLTSGAGDSSSLEEANGHMPIGGNMSDAGGGDLESASALPTFLSDTPKLSISRAQPAMPIRNGTSNGLSFNFSAATTPPLTNSVNVAAVIARESQGV